MSPLGAPVRTNRLAFLVLLLTLLVAGLEVWGIHASLDNLLH
jgi:hypothetical protein